VFKIAGKKPALSLPYDVQKTANPAILKLSHLYALICPDFTATYSKNGRVCMHYGASGVDLIPLFAKVSF